MGMDQMESCVPPGFRFHPTEEELVGYYLKRKVNSLKFDLDVIIEIDLYRMEPWDIQDKCKLGYDERNEWYFFSHKDRKYPTGTRTNRATAAGFWKATGRDKAVLSKNKIIGMRKTLVFYKGRAPNGRKSDWIMHEYRLQTSEHAPPQEEGWVVCRAFKKPSPSHKQGFESWNHQINKWYYMRNNNNNNNNNNTSCFIGSPSLPPDHIISSSSPTTTDSLNQPHTNFPAPHHHQSMNYNNSFDHHHQELITAASNGGGNNQFIENNNNNNNNQLIMDLPRLDSPSLSTSFATKDQVSSYDHHHHHDHHNHDHHDEGSSKQQQWDILDNLLGNSSQIILPDDQTTTTSSSYSNPPTSMQLADTHDYELDVQNQLGSFLGCFPTL